MAQPSLRLRYPSTPARRVSGVRLPDTAVSPRFNPVRTSRWAGGDAFTPASGGQDLHLHKDRVTRPFRLAACPEVYTSFQPTDRTLHNAAFRIRTRGLSITVAVRYRLKIQTFAARYFWEMAWRDTVLIGNLPTSLLPLSRHAFRPGIWSTAFCESGDFAAWYNSRKRQRRTWQEESIA
jgi:hypothetical protein